MPLTNDDLEALLTFIDDKVSTRRSESLQSNTSAARINLESTSAVVSCPNNDDFSHTTVTKLQIPKTNDYNDHKEVLILLLLIR